MSTPHCGAVDNVGPVSVRVTVSAMRWDNLFDDLESQLEQGLTAEELDLKAEEERLRLGRLGLRDRIVAILHAQKFNPAYSIRSHPARRREPVVAPGGDRQGLAVGGRSG